MAEQSLVVRLMAQVQGYVNGMRQAEVSTRALEAAQAHAAQSASQSQQTQAQLAQEHARSMDELGTKAGVAGLAIAAGVGLAVKTYADFDQAMSGVRAQLGGTGADMGKLEAAIRDAGSSTVFSSTEAAEAAEELAKAGLTASDIMGGALAGALSLAATDNIALADAATYSANAMQTFGLKAGDVGHIADVLANGSLLSTASVKSLAQGMSQAGLVAKSMGLSLEDTVGTLAAFDQAGLKGSDAGTSLKTMLTALANPSEKAASTMEELGINVYDAQGNFIGLEGLAGQLQSRLGGLTQQQRNAALATIFGSDAIRAANVLYTQGADGIKGWIDGVNKSGTAALIAAQKQNNWKGDLEKLQGALQDFFIGAGSGADGPLRKLTQWATNFLGVLGKLPDGVKSTGLLLAALGSAALLGIAGVIKVGKAFRDTRRDIQAGRAALRLWSTQAGGTGSVISGLGARVRTLGQRFRSLGTRTKIGIGVATTAVLALGAAMTQTGDAQEGYGRSTDKLTNDLIAAATKGKGLNDVFADLQIAMGSDKSLSFADGLSVATSKAGGLGETIGKLATGFGTFGTGASSSADAVKARLKGLGEALAGLVEDGHADVAAKAFAQIQAEAKKSGVSTAELNKLMPAYADALQNTANKQKLAADSGKDNAAALKKQQEEAQAAADAFQKETDAIANLGSALLEQRGDQVGFEAALDDATKALKDNGRTLDIHTEKGRANRTALDQIAASTDKWAANTFKTTGSQRQANAVIAEGRKHYIAMAKSMGMSAKDAENLADKLFKLPPGTDTSVKVDGIDGAIYKLDKADNLVVSLNGKHVTIPADTPNAEQVAAALYSINDAVLASNGKSVKIPTKAIDSPQTLRNLLGIKGARINADGSVSIPTSALNAAETTRLLGVLGRTAVDADGKTVIIPASTPNAPAVIDLINRIHGAQISTNGKKVTITSSAPLAEDTKRKINNIKGAQVDANGRSVTINSSVPNYSTVLGQIRGILGAAQDKSFTVSAYYVTTKVVKHVDERISRGAGLVFHADGGPAGIPMLATGGIDYRTGGRVTGPGTATSDSILARLSTGLVRLSDREHVLTAAEVTAMGGHGAVLAMRRAARAGQFKLTGYATGGVPGGTSGHMTDWRRALPVQSTPRVIVQSGGGGMSGRDLAAWDRIATRLERAVEVGARAGSHAGSKAGIQGKTRADAQSGHLARKRGG
ncbi:phage tail tape measure protein [Flexivirga sp.]|uniref:phage tail tape measure protein n=1 Tax=Flexivirga sp. TaxID=1962927 RepID=UPI003F7DAED9